MLRTLVAFIEHVLREMFSEKKPEIPIRKTGLEWKRNSITHGDIKTVFT
jgi:hypothetical protein